MADALTILPHEEDELGPALAALRNALGLDQATVARDAGLPASSISEYERGKTVPSPRSVARILSGMGQPNDGLDVAFHFVRSVRASMGRKQPQGSSLSSQPGGPAPALAMSVLEILATGASSATLGHRDAPFRRPGPEDRLHAPALWSRLQRYSPKECRAIVQENPEFRSWSLCALLCEKSERAAADSPVRAEQLAELALQIASLVSGDDEWRSSLQGYSYAFLGNAYRVGGDLRRAEEAFGHSDKLWQTGDNGTRELLDEARLLDLKASLRREQRRLPEALDLLNQALTLSEGPVAGRILIKKSKTLEELNDPEGAVAALREAAPLVEYSADTRLLLCVHFNLLVLLGILGRHAEADLLAPKVRSLTELLGNALDLVRLRWLEARISAGLGRGYEEVAEALREVKEGFTARGIAYDAALVSLELAMLSLESGRTAEVRQLAREMAPIFRAQGVQRETLAALRVFCEAAEREAATLEMARKLLELLERGPAIS